MKYFVVRVHTSSRPCVNNLPPFVFRRTWLSCSRFHRRPDRKTQSVQTNQEYFALFFGFGGLI